MRGAATAAGVPLLFTRVDRMIRGADREKKAVAPDLLLVRLVVFTAFLSMFAVFAVTHSFGAFVNSITNEFHASRAAVSGYYQ
jgi:hypothetical protein